MTDQGFWRKVLSGWTWMETLTGLGIGVVAGLLIVFLLSLAIIYR